MGHYLVTGAAGFIASRVCELLIEQGHSVVGIDNLNNAYDVRLKHYRLSRLQKLPGFEFHLVDIGDRKGLEEVGRGPSFDAVINLAARDVVFVFPGTVRQDGVDGCWIGE